ncbi:MAG: RluA family pseudouridine synthase [Bacilli bacterium]|nr:RluA family pseudouridine synthase [Bacilli bacterium]
MKLITVDEYDCDIRLDKYLVDILNITRSKVQKLIDEGNVLVNDKVVKNHYIVRTDDEIKIDEVVENYEIKSEDMDLNIVYEDEDLIVINKPSGIVVHPSVGHYSGTLVNGLMYHCKLSNNGVRPGIVHRIDKDTSGLLLVAKNDDAHLSLSEQLKNKTVVRKYIALVNGIINHETGTIDAPIGRDKEDRKKMAVTEINSKNAVTNFKVLERLNNASLIECILETGRTHQIRVHMKYIGYPIINDSVYGNKKVINDYGQMLHAKTIGFIHPRTKEYMEFDSELPKEFVEILNMFK